MYVNKLNVNKNILFIYKKDFIYKKKKVYIYLCLNKVNNIRLVNFFKSNLLYIIVL